MSYPRMAEEMMAYRVPPEERGYIELSMAVISLAISDYRKCTKYPCEKLRQDLRRFFLSDIFENISGVANPDLFLRRLDEQIASEIKSGVKRKRDKRTMLCNR